MKTTTQKLTEWAINKIKSEYPGDVALLVAVEGHSVNGDEHGLCFDYYVPATERGLEFGRTFIIGGIGYDLYPRSWERTERTANLDDRCTLCLGNAKILYSRSKEDEERFLALRQKLFDNLKNEEFMYVKALGKIDEAMNLYRTMMFENEMYKVRMAAGYIANYLSIAVAYLNGTYQNDWRIGNIAHLSKLQKLPDGLIQYIRSMLDAKTSEELKSLSHLMISTVRRFTAANAPARAQSTVEPDLHGLADWYQELSLTFRRLAYYCDINDAEMALTDACSIQNELLIVREEFGLKEMDLLGCYDSADLSRLKERSIELERYIIDTIESNGVKIDKYNTVDDFLTTN